MDERKASRGLGECYVEWVHQSLALPHFVCVLTSQRFTSLLNNKYLGWFWGLIMIDTTNAN